MSPLSLQWRSLEQLADDPDFVARAAQEFPSLAEALASPHDRTAIHGLHLIGGLVLVGWIILRAWQHEFSARYHTPVAVVGLYWSFVDIVWIVLYPLIYLVGRGP